MSRKVFLSAVVLRVLLLQIKKNAPTLQLSFTRTHTHTFASIYTNSPFSTSTFEFTAARHGFALNLIPDSFLHNLFESSWPLTFVRLI